MASRVTSFAAIELVRSPGVIRTAETIGGVTIFGLRELQCADRRAVGFIEAWRDAMCFEMGCEEFEKLCLSRRR